MAVHLWKRVVDLRLMGFILLLIAGYIVKGSIPASKKGKCKGETHFTDGGKCTACYTGECCNIKASKPPKFVTSSGGPTSETVNIARSDLVSGEVFHTVLTTDDDQCGPGPEVKYELNNHLEKFAIDDKSGDLEVKDTSKLDEDIYELTINAKNVDDSASNKLYLTVNFYRSKGEDEDYLSRDRRATETNANVTYDLIKKAPHTNKTDMNIGQKIGFRLTITFPAEATNMLVELFTPDNETILMMLCGVSIVSKGTNLDIEHSNVEPVLYSAENNKYHDRAVINFGNITNSGTDTDVKQSQIVIDYDAVMLDRSCQNGSVHWVSAGAEYNYESDVWVGQASFECIRDSAETFSNVPEVNFTGPSTMTIGSSAVFTVDLYIPYPAVDLSFDAFAPLNTSNVMSICSVKGKDAAENYDCGFDINANSEELFPEGNVKGNARGHLSLGVAINKGAREVDNVVANNRITVQFSALVFDDPALVGQEVWLGAAAEIGSNQIWAGQLKITITDKVLSSPVITFNAPPAPTGKASMYNPVIVEGTISLPRDSTASYKLEVSAPHNGGGDPLLQICSVRLSSVGEHCPCADTTIEPEYTSTIENGVIDGAILDIGSITNVGAWGSNSSDSADDINYRIIVKATNYTSANADLTVALYVDSTKLTPQTVTIEYEAAPGSLPEVANSSVPTMTMAYKIGNDHVQVGAATRFALEINTARDVILPVMDIEFIMPNDSAAEGYSPITICRTEIVSVGKNLPCATKSVVNKAITYDQKYSGGLYDRSIINMGPLCNSEVVNDTAEDRLTLETVVVLHEHGDNTNGNQQWLSGGLMFTEKMMWVGQLSLTTLTNETLTASTPPYVEVVTNTSADTPVGYSAVHTVVIKPTPGDHAKYFLNVSTSANELTICNVRLLAKGHNLPCVKDDPTIDATKDPSGRITKISVDAGMVSNIGSGVVNTNGIYDDNTLMFEVVVQLSKTAADNSDFTYDVLTTYGGVDVTKTVTIHSTHDTSGIVSSSNESSTIDIGVLPITKDDNSSEVVKGQAKRIYLDIFVPFGVTQDLTARVLAPVDKSSVVEIKYIGLLEAGENLPCLNRDATTADYLNRTTTYPSNFAVATLGLGYVCNVGVKKDDPNANRIRVEAVVRVLKNDSLTAGTTITLSGSLNTNDERIAIVQHDLTVTDTFTDILPENMTLLDDKALKLNITDDPIVMNVHEEKVIPFHIIVPPFMTANVKFDVDLPVNDSAVLTFKEIKVTGSGKNLAGYGYQEEELTVVEKSTHNTSEINKAFVDLGIVTNAGTSHRIDDTNYDDDVINMEVTVVMGDSAINENGTTHWISLGVKIGIYIVILEHNVMVLRDGFEKPCIEFTGEVDNVESSDTKVVIKTLLKHSNESTAISTNMTAFVLFPPFLQFLEITSINDTYVTCNNLHDSNMLQIMCDHFYFSDVVAVTAVLEQKPNYQVPTDIKGQDAIITLATASEMHARASNQYGSEVDFSCNMNYVNHTVSVTPKPASNCTIEAFGMGDTVKIKDCQISGSPDHYADGGPTEGRTGGKGFAPFVRQGSLNKQRYFQVYFGNKASVQEIIVDKGTGTDLVSNVEKIHPYFSDDGYAWMPASELTVNQPFPATVTVSGGREARYIRVYITQESNEGKKLGVTFEFKGCYLTTDKAGDELCDGVKEEGVTNPEWHRSGFLNYESNLYVCDATADDGLKQACYKTTNGDNWERLDERLGCMIGAAEGNLYALAGDGKTYMSSEDSGQTWASVRKEKFEDVKINTAGFKAPKKMKWEADAALEGTVPDAGHTDGEWGATFAGIRKQNGVLWPVKFNWASCCGK